MAESDAPCHAKKDLVSARSEGLQREGELQRGQLHTAAAAQSEHTIGALVEISPQHWWPAGQQYGATRMDRGRDSSPTLSSATQGLLSASGKRPHG